MDPQAQCRRCGYPLRGLSRPACPECGRGFDPNNPRSYTTLTRLAQTYMVRMYRGQIAAFLALVAMAWLGGVNSAWVAAVGVTAAAATVWMLVHLYRCARLVRSPAYAVGHVVAAVVLLPIFLFGLTLIPALVAGDVRAALGLKE